MNGQMELVNLMKSYPVGKGSRFTRTYTLEERMHARKFEKSFFDGTRHEGCGGYVYDGRWKPIAKDMIGHYQLPGNAKILDIGCAKGFLLYDFLQLLPQADVAGIDISEYAVQNGIEELRDKLIVRDAVDLKEYGDDEFDLVISINTLHNLPFDQCFESIKEIERIGKNKYIQVEAWRNEQEREAFRSWQLTGGFYDDDGTWIPFGTTMSTSGWERFLNLAGYTGEYWWTIFEAGVNFEFKPEEETAKK